MREPAVKVIKTAIGHQPRFTFGTKSLEPNLPRGFMHKTAYNIIDLGGGDWGRNPEKRSSPSKASTVKILVVSVEREKCGDTFETSRNTSKEKGV